MQKSKRIYKTSNQRTGTGTWFFKVWQIDTSLDLKFIAKIEQTHSLFKFFSLFGSWQIFPHRVHRLLLLLRRRLDPRPAQRRGLSMELWREWRLQLRWVHALTWPDLTSFGAGPWVLYPPDMPLLGFRESLW